MSYTRANTHLRLGVVLSFAAILLMSCQSGGESVVTAPTPTPATSSSPGAAASATPATTTAGPTTSPSTQAPAAAGRAGDPFAMTPGGSQLKGPASGSGKNITGMPGVITRPYKPTPTPGDPFPPRPTPTLVLKNGKPVQEWQAPPEALSLDNPFAGKPDAVKIGESYYNQRCSDCHGKRGMGNGPMSRGLKKVPTNLASRMVQANSDGELFWKITNGRSPMPANRVRFDDDQRWYIVSFLRSLK
jgi:mono/diheme cytochrome c family protein